MQNALASDKTCLRSTLLKNITEVLDKNSGFQDLLGTSDTRVFEIGTVFDKADETIVEHTSFCFGVRLKASGYSGKEDKVVSAVREALEDILHVTLSPQAEKGVLEVNLTELLDKLPDPTAYEPVGKSPEIVYQPFSLYPSMSRDIAMWVGEGVTEEEVTEILHAAAGYLCVRITHVDTFAKEGRTSMAFRLVFQSNEKTLSGTEVDVVMKSVYEAVAKQGWESR